MSISLKFNPDIYEVKTCLLEDEEIRYRAYMGINYCTDPTDDVQKLNIFVPEDFYEGKRINGYGLKDAPIFMPNSVGGYMEGAADEPGTNFQGLINSIFRALQHGYVVAAPGIRGRNTGIGSNEFFVGSVVQKEAIRNGKLSGRAPALIVDYKAAIRYLRYNRDDIPGDTEKIVTSGTSAGGALSALAGATGNSADYAPFLKAIGAADERDDVWAANCYCPIHNLENADSAYEWLFHSENTAHMMRNIEKDGKVERIPDDFILSPEQMRTSGELKALFPKYLNSLKLKDEDGNLLTLNEEGEGNFKQYVIRHIIDSAKKELKDHDSFKRNPVFMVKGSKVEDMDALTFTDGGVSGLNFNAYVAKITRMKPAPAFDALDLRSPENEEFGDEAVFARHFTDYSHEHSFVKGEMADSEKIKMLNPTRYIGLSDTAKNWRIRHGTFDRDTSLAIPVILATMLKNKGYNVDFFLPWGLPHSGDYDLDELFEWIDGLSKNR